MIRYENIAKDFNIKFSKYRPDITLDGSPERCRHRIVIEDFSGQKYILELLKNNQLKTREIIANNLDYLNKLGLDEINPYIRGLNSKFIIDDWMIQKYIDNIPLKRPDYISETWRAKALTDFLKRLKKIKYSDNSEIFDIKSYTKNIQKTIEINKPYIGNVTKVYSEYIDKIPDNLEISFCHGDFHPINILWGENKINSIIDWEFSGMKPEIYDICNLIGCVGIENPKYLESDFLKIILGESKKMISEKSFNNIWIYTLALRFGWMSEWLRKKDKEMIELELEYWIILKNNYL